VADCRFLSLITRFLSTYSAVGFFPGLLAPSSRSGPIAQKLTAYPKPLARGQCKLSDQWPPQCRRSRYLLLPSRRLLWLGQRSVGGLLDYPARAAQPVHRAGDDNASSSNHYFVQNPSLDSAWRVFTYIDRDLYQPLPMLSLMLDTALFGHGPFGYHATNLVFHLLTIVAVWRLVRRLAPARAAGTGRPGGACIHCDSEVVGIAVNRIRCLSALFNLMARWNDIWPL